eukprot:CAMPEP_0175304142 /NCGR_PEP_ID=MMETSP0093-20121207/63078_1 /TAXON_ID=311494 /ORGANISM="Alexandrium monilatum, Strain CCMP3105" /LENGTH=91 /DNA_ID=CAMNT_0016600533 /DNA_START=211 /DNA_END=483 /DNA_ORIENTATION=-
MRGACGETARHRPIGALGARPLGSIPSPGHAACRPDLTVRSPQPTGGGGRRCWTGPSARWAISPCPCGPPKAEAWVPRPFRVWRGVLAVTR